VKPSVLPAKEKKPVSLQAKVAEPKKTSNDSLSSFTSDDEVKPVAKKVKV
jgi:hypothetical protein